jgi:hypothetical protein
MQSDSARPALSAMIGAAPARIGSICTESARRSGQCEVQLMGFASHRPWH